MISQSHFWGGVTATVYYLDRGEMVDWHKHEIEHTTSVIAGSAEVDIEGLEPFYRKVVDGPFELPARLKHRIRSMEHGTIVMNMIVGGTSGDQPKDGADGGVILVDE